MILLLILVGAGLAVFYLWPVDGFKSSTIQNSVSNILPEMRSTVVPVVAPVVSPVTPTANYEVQPIDTVVPVGIVPSNVVPSEYEAIQALLKVRDRLQATGASERELTVLLSYVSKLMRKEIDG